jgi:RNA polymerase sigma-70 factor (ECF subfamily)
VSISAEAEADLVRRAVRRGDALVAGLVDPREASGTRLADRATECLASSKDDPQLPGLRRRSAGDQDPAGSSRIPVPLSALEERELVRVAQRGDLLAMSRLVDSLAPWIARICGGIALDDADDAAQEALVQVFRGLKDLRDPAALRGWARRIAVREAVRHAQRAREERAREDGEISAELVAPARDLALASDVRTVLAGLAPEQRAILVLRDLEGLSEEDAAAQLGVARGTVKSRLFRARAAFAKRWLA